MKLHPLEVLFRPRNVALIGASEEESSVGRSLLVNLKQGRFSGAIYPVNPRHATLMGLPCYPSVTALPQQADLAVIATPARTVPGVIRECVQAGVAGAIIISAGFREAGPAGAALEQEILAEARKGDLRILGPNCLGLMNPQHGFNATFAHSMALPGHLAFISQSGALCTAILDWSQREMVGFSAFVSVGSMLDVGWGDLIQYLGDDPATRSIAIYMESVGDARAFLSAAREVALSKPIIAIKPGRTAAAAKAAASHTGALTGEDDVIDAAFRRCGVLRVNTIAELFYLSEALEKQPRPKGPRLTILTNAGGPGVLAADAVLEEGGELAVLSPKTVEEFNRFVPPHWSHQNPIDILGDATPERYSRAVELAAKDPGTDGLLVILAPTGLTDPASVAQVVAARARLDGKPVIASWMGGASIARAETILNEARIPTYAYPDSAARVFELMWRNTANLRALYETPARVEADARVQAEAAARAGAIIGRVRASGRVLLTEAESKELLGAYGIPTVPARVAASADEAVEAANGIGYPVVLKLHSETITHKTDVGGVKLDLPNDAAVRGAFQAIQESVEKAAGPGNFLGVTVQPMVGQLRDGYEAILGSSTDSQFGPVLLFGSGGQLVEVYQDRAIGLPPLNTTLARLMMERTKIYSALKGVRGRKAVDLNALAQLLVRFSFLVTEQLWIKEIDINPLLVAPDHILALDARVALHPADTAELPRPAIRPYPVQYVRPWKFEDGEEILIRPIRPDDEPLIARFHARLSERSVYQRYFHLIGLDERTSHDRLIRTCFNDYDREIALVAERNAQGESEILAVARMSKTHLLNRAELAFLIVDEYQNKGLGTELAHRLLEIARVENLDAVSVEILAENRPMLNVCRELGFTLRHSAEGVVHGELELKNPR
jgi:acetyltransferase